jgi:hypothetical protein
VQIVKITTRPRSKPREICFPYPPSPRSAKGAARTANRIGNWPAPRSVLREFLKSVPAGAGPCLGPGLHARRAGILAERRQR